MRGAVEAAPAAVATSAGDLHRRRMMGLPVTPCSTARSRCTAAAPRCAAPGLQPPVAVAQPRLASGLMAARAPAVRRGVPCAALK